MRVLLLLLKCFAIVFNDCPSLSTQFSIDLAAFVGIDDDVDFCKKLLAEESVFLLPGQV